MREVNKAAKELVTIDNAQLVQTLVDLDAMRQERKALDQAISVAKEKALEELGEVEGALVRHYGKVYRLPVQVHYLDTQALKADNPTLYDKYFRSGKTGGHYLMTYPNKA